MTHDAHASNLPTGGQLSDAICKPHPGSGLVARWDEVLLVVGEAEDAVAALLLDLCRAVAQAGGDGRTLSRRLAGFLTTYDREVPAFAAATPVATGLAVFVHGAASVDVGEKLTISGAASLAWVDRLIPWPVSAITIRTGSATEPASGPYDLQRGVVPGSGLTLHGVSTDQPPTDATAGSVLEGRPSQVLAAADVGGHLPEPSVTLPPDRWPGQGEPAGFDSVVMNLNAPAADEEPPRAPLPIMSERRPERSKSDGPVVRGVYCKNNHFNDARMLFCAVCGINMVQQTPVLTEGPRPPLGVLLLDDGSAFQLDSDYVLGREPGHDEDVRAGRLRGILLSDADKTVSRAHARIELRQWDVVLIDNGSANGTYVASEGENEWTPLPPGTPHILSSGSRIQLGSRTLIYNSHRGV